MLVLFHLGVMAHAAPRRPRPEVRLHLEECIGRMGAPLGEVRRQFAIELDVQLDEDPRSAQVAAMVWARCIGEAVELRVDDPVTGKSLSRSVALTAAERRARPRLLALALAELLFTSWTELEVNLEPQAVENATTPLPRADETTEPAARPPARASLDTARSAARQMVQGRLHAALRKERALRLLALGSGQAFFAGTGFLFGGGLRIGGSHRYHLGWLTDVMAHHGEVRLAQGSIAVDSISLSTALLFQHNVSLSAQRGLRLGLAAGGGLRGGVARLAGEPADPLRTRGAVVWGPQLSPTFLFSATLGLPRRLCIDLSIEGGHVVVPVAARVDGVRALAVDGPYVGLQLGLGVIP